MTPHRPEARSRVRPRASAAVATLVAAALALGAAACGESPAPVPTPAPEQPPSQAAPQTPESSPEAAPPAPGETGAPGGTGAPGETGAPGGTGTPGGTGGSGASGSACTARAAALPLRARLAQRLMVGIAPDQPGLARQVVSKYGVGGIFLSGKPTALLKSTALASMRAVATIPVAVAVDEEGGRVQRINQIVGSMPSARQLAATKTPAQVKQLAAQRGRQLRQLGITVDFAPDADVSDEPANGAIGDRSFSSDPAKVASYAAAFAAGLRSAGILPVFKHFPGHGHGSGDSHDGSVTTPALSAMRKNDLVPYRTILGTGPEAVMLGHLKVPGLTDGLPASLSPPAYRLLRSQYKFGGVTITDDLGAMKAITNSYDLPHAALTAMRAGADIALWTSSANLGAVLTTLEGAVKNGQLPERDVNDSVARILAVKGACRS